MMTQTFFRFQLFQPLGGALLSEVLGKHKEIESKWLKTAVEKKQTNCILYPVSFTPAGGSTRFARGRKGDLGE